MRVEGEKVMTFKQVDDQLTEIVKNTVINDGGTPTDTNISVAVCEIEALAMRNAGALAEEMAKHVTAVHLLATDGGDKPDPIPGGPDD
jgi:hypothetical protein